MSVSKNTFQGIDLAKLIFSIMIVMMHSDFLSGMGFEFNVQITIFALAVPFFFIATGFFTGKKLSSKTVYVERVVVLKHSIFRLAKLYLLFGSWYFICELIKIIIKKEEFSSAVVDIFHRLIVQSPGGGMWYVYSAVIGLLVVLYFVKKEWPIRFLFWASFFTYMFGNVFFMNKFSAGMFQIAYKNIFISDMNIIFFGVYLYGGILLGSVYERLKEFSKNTIVLLAITLFVYTLFGLFVHDTNNIGSVLFFSFMKCLSCFSLFWLCVNMKSFCNSTVGIRNLSTSIYFFHWNFVNLIILLRKTIPGDRVILSLLCTVLSVVFALIFTFYKNGEYYKKIFD